MTASNQTSRARLLWRTKAVHLLGWRVADRPKEGDFERPLKTILRANMSFCPPCFMSAFLVWERSCCEATPITTGTTSPTTTCRRIITHIAQHTVWKVGFSMQLDQAGPTMPRAIKQFHSEKKSLTRPASQNFYVFSKCNKLGLEKCNNLWRQATLKMQVFPNKAPMILQQEILPQFRVPDSLFATCAEDDAATKTSKKQFQLAELICAPQFRA